MASRSLYTMVIVAALLTACGDSGSEGSATGGVARSTAEGGTVTVTGALGGKILEEGVCTWVETEEERIEVWGGEDLGQSVSFLQDGTFEGIRALDASEADGVGAIVFAPGDRVTVTGVTYEAEPECGSYGVNATEPWSLA
jgi:hypothetical protein